MAIAMEIDPFSWQLSHLGEGIEYLARRVGLKPASTDPIVLPAGVATGSAAELSRWVTWAGSRLGLEAEAIDVTAASVDDMLQRAGPAILQCGLGPRRRFVLLVNAGRRGLRVLCPDLQVRRVPTALVRQALCASHEAALAPEIDRVLDLAAVTSGRQPLVRSLIARERLGSSRIGGGWILRLPPSAGFWRQLVEARLPRRLGAMLTVFVVTYVLEITGWGLIGAAALEGRLDLGWMTAWIMLMLTIIPLRLIGGWLSARLSLDVSRLIKTRLLIGALQFDVEDVRRQGAGQLLGRVMESQAFESLALNFGLASVVAAIELALAAWVLSAGAAGLSHVVLLGLWVAVAIALSFGYFRRLRAWTGQRLRMTHALVERMVGHRTTLAQESADRRDQQQDGSMKEYLQVSAGLDKAALPFLAGLPGGWMILGLGALAPAFVSGTATPVSLAISIGGVLLAGRAFFGLASGLSSAAGAAVAWKQIGPLFKAADRPLSSAPFIASQQMQQAAAGDQPRRLIDAEGLTYRYRQESDPVLHNASLTVEHGERLLVEGPSGSGKSTLASLLVGLRQPDAGLLLLNGLDRFTLGESWHQFATEAPQFHENHILTGTLGFNLLMGRNWPATDDELKGAGELCEELGLGALLARMPSGLMQNVGETGWQLSHGERSRIFLARALLQNAPLTVLDESFAALDPESLETCLGSALRRAQTLMVIAHP